MTDTDFNQWKTELALPPVENCLRLCDYLPPETQAFLTSSGLPEELMSYTWQEEATYEKVARWGKAAMLAGQLKQPAGSESFFITAIKDAYDYDRAVRAARTLGKQPFRRSDIEERILRPQSAGEQLPYILTEKAFEWTVDTPEEAVDATALVLQTERPDRLWLAEYVQEGASREQIRAGVAAGLGKVVSDIQTGKWDPIIYAEYGDWQVEVARWE